jgi:hypothetical protein
MFVFIVLGQHLGGLPYIVAVFATEEQALAHMRRWIANNADGIAHVERYAIVNGPT